MAEPTPTTTALGFDFGTAKIGIAVGQTFTGTASPITTLRSVNQKPDWEGIAKLIGEWRPQALVVGVPIPMDGDEESEVAGRARRFARQLEGRFRLPVHLVDEKLTSREAWSRLDRYPKKIEQLDSIAAKLILETWFCERH